MSDAERLSAIGTSAAPGAAWIGFTLAGQHYLAPVAQVQEIIVPNEITPVPGAPAAVLGIMNLRSRLLVVMDGCRRLSLSPTAREPGSRQSERVLVLDAGNEPLGLLVEAIGELAVLDEARIDPPPSGRNSRLGGPVRGVVRREHGFTAVLDVARLCDPEAILGVPIEDGGRDDE